MVNLLHIFEGKLRHRNAAVDAAFEQAFQRKDAHGFPHGVARNSEPMGERNLLQRGARAQFAIQDSLPQDSRDLIGYADSMNLRAFYDAHQCARFSIGLFKMSSVEQFSVHTPRRRGGLLPGGTEPGVTPK
jgi:hypothetical protein